VFREINGHISANTNSALEIAEGEYVVLLDHDDLISKDALYQVVKTLQNNPDANYIYSDEDKLTEQGARYDPYFKPDWNPDLLLHQHSLSHLSIIKRSFLNEIGGFRVGFEGSQDWDMALRVTRLVPAESIVHIPHVLYHWRAVSGSTAKATDQKSYIKESQYKTLQAHFDALQIPVTISLNDVQYWNIEYPIPDPQPLVSIIVPTKNQKKLLQKCIESILSLTTYRNFEILVVDNRTDEDEAKTYLNSISTQPGITVLEYDKDFNFSGINNFAVSNAKGSLVVLMNNDIDVLTGNWLEEMVSLAIRENTGAVGAKLLYPNRTIQHAGVVLGVGGVANHAYLDAPAEVVGQMGRARIVQNMSAVTAALLLIEKRKFLEVGGFNEVDLKIAFNDVDLCLKLLEAGYRNVWTPNAVFTHHESVSRGQEDTPSKQARFASEVQYMLDNWSELLESDPAYNPNLSIERADFSLSFPPRVPRV
jgi:GT2 family glycosyltransferase